MSTLLHAQRPESAGYSPNEKKLDHIMNELDVNKDGVVVFKEFLRPTSNKCATQSTASLGFPACVRRCMPSAQVC